MKLRTDGYRQAHHQCFRYEEVLGIRTAVPGLRAPWLWPCTSVPMSHSWDARRAGLQRELLRKGKMQKVMLEIHLHPECIG